MTTYQKQSPVDKTRLCGYETAGARIVASAEKIGNDQKLKATLSAQFALRGYCVHAVSDGFLVSRWNLTKHVPDLDALEAFGRVVGAV